MDVLRCTEMQWSEDSKSDIDEFCASNSHVLADTLTTPWKTCS